METPTELAGRLTRASRKKIWDVHTRIDWPESLDDSRWFMAPELISLYGTDAWGELDEATQRRLSAAEIANFFSLTLQGERPLVQGLCNQMYSRQNSEITEYIHHFLDEENKHMLMFGEYCRRYHGKVYDYKKLVMPKKYAKGEEDVTFFIKVMIVEELGDFYNVAMQRDERLHEIVQVVNRIHHEDEARHLIFGRRLLKDLWEEWSPTWDEETLDGVRKWLPAYLKSSWNDFYNVEVYRDAGIEDAYAVRKAAMADPICKLHREKVSEKLVDYFIDTGILEERPEL